MDGTTSTDRGSLQTGAVSCAKVSHCASSPGDRLRRADRRSQVCPLFPRPSPVHIQLACTSLLPVIVSRPTTSVIARSLCCRIISVILDHSPLSALYRSLFPHDPEEVFGRSVSHDSPSIGHTYTPDTIRQHTARSSSRPVYTACFSTPDHSLRLQIFTTASLLQDGKATQKCWQNKGRVQYVLNVLCAHIISSHQQLSFPSITPPMSCALPVLHFRSLTVTRNHVLPRATALARWATLRARRTSGLAETSSIFGARQQHPPGISRPRPSPNDAPWSPFLCIVMEYYARRSALTVRGGLDIAALVHCMSRTRARRAATGGSSR